MKRPLLILSVLLVMALMLAPLPAVFASGVTNVDVVKASDVDSQALGAGSMMADCEQATAMQHDSEHSCQTDSHCCVAVFVIHDLVAVPARYEPVHYRLSMLDDIVPLFTKPPRFTL